MESKKRLDVLIKKSRADLYKPIAVAEILYRHRTEFLDVSSINSYRRKSYEWMREVIWKLHRKTTSLNSRYWDQLFDKEVLPPEQIEELANFNSKNKGVIEVYIYDHVQEKYRAFSELRATLKQLPLDTFSLDTFLVFFENNAKFRGSIDKAYEISVYALFNSVVEELQATVTLSVSKTKKTFILVKFPAPVCPDRNPITIRHSLLKEIIYIYIVKPRFTNASDNE